MDITTVYGNRSQLRELDHDYRGPSLRKFGDRDVRVGSQPRSGRARADRFRGLGRTFKSMLARAADYFHFPQSRSARRFNRAHEAYSREADKLLDDLATNGSAIDPAELANRLQRLRARANEMAKHIAMEGPDGEKMTREDAKAMGRKPLLYRSASQARTLRTELLAARVDVALNTFGQKKGPSEYNNLKDAFNGIDWEKVEAGLESLRDGRFREMREMNDLARENIGVASSADRLMTEGVAANAAIMSDLRTVRDLVVTSNVSNTDPGDGVERGLDGIFGALDDETSRPNLQGLRGKLRALGEMRNTPRYRLERVFRDKVADLPRSDADRFRKELVKEVRDSPVNLTELRFAAWFPESGKERLKTVADLVQGKDLRGDDEAIDRDLAHLRRDLNNFLTLVDVLEERDTSTGETFREQAVGNHREGLDSIAG